MRKSNQRDLILDIVNNSKDHLSSEEIYYVARKSIPNISLGTVYRNLSQLVDNNNIIKIKTDEGIDRYDNILMKHHHFICSKCNKIIDVFDDNFLKIKNIDDNIVIDYEINYKGICSNCKEE